MDRFRVVRTTRNQPQSNVVAACGSSIGPGLYCRVRRAIALDARDFEVLTGPSISAVVQVLGVEAPMVNAPPSGAFPLLSLALAYAARRSWSFSSLGFKGVRLCCVSVSDEGIRMNICIPSPR